MSNVLDVLGIILHWRHIDFNGTVNEIYGTFVRTLKYGSTFLKIKASNPRGSSLKKS